MDEFDEVTHNLSDEDWEGYHNVFQDKLENDGLDKYDESAYSVWRNIEIRDHGESVRAVEFPFGGADGGIVSNIEEALVTERKFTDEARGKVFRLQGEFREVKRKLNIYEQQATARERAESSQERREEKKRRKEEEVAVALLDRLPPHDVITERFLLGLYLNHPESMEGFNQKYVNKMFYASAHEIAHRVMIGLGKKTDRVILEAELKKQGYYEAVGGAVFLDELEAFGQRANPEGVTDYINIIEECFLRREWIHWCTKRIGEGYHNERIDEKGKGERINSWTEHIRASSSEVINLLPYRFRKRFDRDNMVEEVIKDFKDLVDREGKPKISTGYKGLDRIMHGIFPNRLVAMGARTKQGKTTLCLNIAKNVAEQGYDVAYFSSPSENSVSDLIQLLISNYAKVDSERFVFWNRKTIPESYLQAIDEAAEKVKKLPIHLDGSAFSPEYIRERCIQLKATYPNLALAVVDSLQGFAGYVPYQGNKSDIYTEILKGLKGVAGYLGVTVMVTGQLKAIVDRRKNKKPNGVDDFSDCKGIPDVADSAILLYRPEVYWPEDKRHRGKLYVIPPIMRRGDPQKKDCILKVDMKTARVYSHR